MRRCVVLAACMFFIAATSAHAEFYRWVDKDGKEFFTNELEKVPQEYRGSVQTVKPDESRVSVGDRPSAAVKPGGLSGEHKDKNGRGEEYWRRRAANLRLKLRDQQDEYTDPIAGRALAYVRHDIGVLGVRPGHGSPW